MKTFMFPGQGSQSRGMGRELFDKYGDLVDKADKILGYSIKELCLEDSRRELNKTQFTQPALYVVNALSYFKNIEDTGQKPDFVAGHSLGEYNALLAAGCFDFEAGLKLVKKRGELMAEAPKGGMAAILNASKEKIEKILAENHLSNIDLANYNTPTQIVISGPIDEISEAQEYFQIGDILYCPLNTGGAFHSRYMTPVKEKFSTYMKSFNFSPPKIPVISNVTARPYKDEQVLENLSNQIATGVRWSDSIQYLMGISPSESMAFEEVGNGDVLTKILHTIKAETSKSLGDLSVQNSEKDVRSLEQENEPVSALMDAEEKVKSWNIKFPVGTKFKSSAMEYDELETRTEAIVLFGHRAAVYMKEYNGYFDIDEITPL